MDINFSDPVVIRDIISKLSFVALLTVVLLVANFICDRRTPKQ
jgi:hypothetical protein